MHLRRLALLALAVVAILGCALPSPASAATRFNVPVVAKKVVDRITANSPVPVYLPNALTIRGSWPRAFASGGKTATGWDIRFAYVRNCGGAEACSMADFNARKRNRLFDPANVTLAKGTRGHYYPISCGGSCSPAAIDFVIDGVLYEFSVTDPAGRTKAALITLANQAINYGPR